VGHISRLTVMSQPTGWRKMTDQTVVNQSKTRMWPMPNVMAALPNISGALCSTPQSLADAHYYMPCSDAAKTRNPLKFAGVPQTNERISAASGLKFTILWVHMEDILLLNKFFFPIVDTCLSCEDIARRSCAMVPRWRFLTTFASGICSEPQAARFRPAF